MASGFFHQIADRYRRWRHSRGFGVHSPFAYALVKDALYPPHSYTYYLENDARLTSENPAEARRARSLYRLAIFLRQYHADPLPIYIWHDAPRCYRAALRLAGTKVLSRPASNVCRILPPEMSAGTECRNCSDAIGTLNGTLILSSQAYTIIIPCRQMADTIYSLP